MSGGLAFFDSNIFVYTDDSSSPEKQEQAINLFSAHLRDGTAVISLQVLQEYFSAATRKLKVPAEKAQQKIENHGSLQGCSFGIDRRCSRN